MCICVYIYIYIMLFKHSLMDGLWMFMAPTPQACGSHAGRSPLFRYMRWTRSLPREMTKRRSNVFYWNHLPLILFSMETMETKEQHSAAENGASSDCCCNVLVLSLSRLASLPIGSRKKAAEASTKLTLAAGSWRQVTNGFYSNSIVSITLESCFVVVLRSAMEFL